MNSSWYSDLRFCVLTVLGSGRMPKALLAETGPDIAVSPVGVPSAAMPP